MRNQEKSTATYWIGVFVGVSFVCQLCCTGAGQAQVQFPAALMGDWCAVSPEGERVDITNSSLEEGDGVCQLRKLQSNQWANATIYELIMSCDTGVEGKKRNVVTGRFSGLRMDGKQYILRAGGMYNSKNLALYKRCS
jgi:hypothetical protein